MNTKKTICVSFTNSGKNVANLLKTHFGKSLKIVEKTELDFFLKHDFQKYDAWIFVGALGICVRKIAPFLKEKKTDPAVLNIDEKGFFVQSVLSGHKGGANELAKEISRILPAQPVISTSSDLQNLWNLDLLAKQFNWTEKIENESFNKIISLFVQRKKTALILKTKDKGSDFLERTCPDFVKIFYTKNADFSAFELLIYVGYEILETEKPLLCFHPKCLVLGSGCSQNMDSDLFEKNLLFHLKKENIAWESVAHFCSVDLKKNETAYLNFCTKYKIPFQTFPKEDLKNISVANPSQKVFEKIGIFGVSESASAWVSGQEKWLLEKTKIHTEKGKFTLAVSLLKNLERKGEIAIVGAGSGDPNLLTLKAVSLLKNADCILYAGSLVPEKCTHFAKEGAWVGNSATMTLEKQMQIIDDFYQKGKKIVRLHSGDPSIYGAIQEQMSFFDEKNYDYFIVPGISSFQSAAAYLKSEFTIPEIAQTIILTRGEGKTPMPSKEKITEMAKLQATMCIFLSVGLAKKMQEDLLQSYPKNTPLAVLYRVSWEDEKVWVDTLENLEKIIKENKLKRTVLIVVGKAIGARKNRSWLYDGNWKHIFRNKDKTQK